MSTTKLFVYSAPENEKLANKFLKRAEPRLDCLREHEFLRWTPASVLPGQDRKVEINERLREADYVVPLLSPELFANMKRGEDSLIGEAFTKIFPVLLIDVVDPAFDGTIECFGIKDLQVYCGVSSKRLSYISCKDEFQRNQFVNGFVESLINSVEGKVGYRNSKNGVASF